MKQEESPPPTPDSDHSETGKRALLTIRILSVAPLIFGLAVYLLHPPFRDGLDRGIGLLLQGNVQELQVWAQELGWWAPFATSLLMVIQALAAPIPAVLVTATNSLLFGWILGGLLSIFSATVAATICYGLGRVFGEPLVVRLVSKKHLRRTDEFMKDHGAVTVIVARLLPFVPFDPISYVAGVCRMHPWTFFWATFVGQIPNGMTYSYLARQIENPGTLILHAIGALAALIVISLGIRHALLRRTRVAT